MEHKCNYRKKLNLILSRDLNKLREENRGLLTKLNKTSNSKQKKIIDLENQIFQNYETMRAIDRTYIACLGADLENRKYSILY